MNKYYGRIGYGVTEETSPGVWESKIVERCYYGDIVRAALRMQNGTSINDDIAVSNQISIVADPFAYQNFQNMKYASYMGTLWKITSVDIQSPRLVLSIGGEYNGESI